MIWFLGSGAVVSVRASTWIEMSNGYGVGKEPLQADRI
jgi:hypothetical protein